MNKWFKLGFGIVGLGLVITAFAVPMSVSAKVGDNKATPKTAKFFTDEEWKKVETNIKDAMKLEVDAITNTGNGGGTAYSKNDVDYDINASIAIELTNEFAVVDAAGYSFSAVTAQTVNYGYVYTYNNGTKDDTSDDIIITRVYSLVLAKGFVSHDDTVTTSKYPASGYYYTDIKTTVTNNENKHLINSVVDNESNVLADSEFNTKVDTWKQ